MGGKTASRKSSRAKEVQQSSEATENYVVEKIVGDRIIKGKTQYKVHWAGYTTDEETWENESQLDCNELLEEYLAENSAEEKAEPVPKKAKTVSPPQPPPAPEEENFAVEKILNDRMNNGKLQYLVHWEGYPSDEDSWEDASNLDCQDLIDEYLSKKAEASRTSKAKGKIRKPIKNGEAKSDERDEKNDEEGKQDKTSDQPDDACDEEGEYVVERVLEMHTQKNGKRMFLVHWKGYSSKHDTWEPEEHLEGNTSLYRFLERVEKAKEVSMKELRVQRKPTDRFTMMPQGDKRRQSKRHANRQRVKYYDAE